MPFSKLITPAQRRSYDLIHDVMLNAVTTLGADQLIADTKALVSSIDSPRKNDAIISFYKRQIKVSFDSKGRLGYNAKGINIHSNAGEINLVFEVYVIE